MREEKKQCDSNIWREADRMLQNEDENNESWQFSGKSALQMFYE